MTKKDKVINDLIKITSAEIDYWTMRNNKPLLEAEYGKIVYRDINARFRLLRDKLFTAIIPLADQGTNKTKKK